jgi:PAS domain S-box-containing protein
MTRILIVDDNPQNLYLLESILKGYKLDVVSARNGVGALDAAIKNPPDLIIADILMPVMDGFELCRRWKADGRLNKIPFMFYTATYTDPKDEKFALSLGADRFIVKPQKPEILGRIVQELLEEYRNKEAASLPKPSGDEVEVLQQYNEVLFRKLEKKVVQLESEIAERRQAEENLQYLANIVNSTDDAIIGKTLDGIIVSWNAGAEALYDYPAAEVIGHPVSLLIPPGENDELPKILARIRNGETISHFETKRVTKSGRIVDVALTISPIRDARGTMTGASTIARDITRRRQTEAALQVYAQRLQEAQKMAHLGFWSWDVKTGQVGWSEEVFRIFGLDPKEFTPQIDSILALSPWPDEQHRDRELIRKATESREPGAYEQRFLRPDKSTGYYYSTFEGRYDDSGTLSSIVGTVLDITGRKQAEEALRESEAKFRSVIEHVPDFILVHRDGRIIFINNSALTLTGYEPREILDQPVTRFVAPEFHGMVASAVKQRMSGEKVEPFEADILTKSGARLTVIIRGSLIDFDGAPASLNVLTDITDRKRAEEQLRKSEVRYRTLYESMMDAFIGVGMDGRIREYNNSFRQMLGYSDQELARLTYLDLTPEKWHKFEEYIIQTQILTRGYSDVYEKEYRKKDGTVFPVEVRAYLLRNDAGRPAGIWAIVRDISERKEAENKIRLANRKLALMTEVTYQDIQNKVTGLRGYVELSKGKTSEPDQLHLLEKETAVLKSIHDLIKHTKEYQQMGVDQSGWIPLEKTIRIQFALQSQKRTIALECDLHGFQIHTDPLVDRVFYNLIHNAIRHGKKITRISFGCQETSDGAVLTCEDDGAGIPPEEKTRIFDRVVGGEGKFGLFFVREFLTLSGMTIRETGIPGGGARFEITVPKGAYRFVP